MDGNGEFPFLQTRLRSSCGIPFVSQIDMPIDRYIETFNIAALQVSIARNFQYVMLAMFNEKEFIVYKRYFDWDEIRTHAGRAHWISSPTP
jgi:hypothetical protein